MKITLCSLVLDALLLTLNSALTKKKVTEKTNQTLIKLITFCRSGGKVGKIARLMYLSVIDMTSRSLVSRWKSHFKALTRTPLEGGLYNYSCYLTHTWCHFQQKQKILVLVQYWCSVFKANHDQVFSAALLNGCKIQNSLQLPDRDLTWRVASMAHLTLLDTNLWSDPRLIVIINFSPFLGSCGSQI